MSAYTSSTITRSWKVEYYNHEATEEESRCKQSPELATVTVWSAGNKQQGWNLGDLHLQVSTRLQQNLVTRKDTLDTSSCLFLPESKPKFSNNFVKRQQFFGSHTQKLHSNGRKRSWEQVLSTAFRLSFNWNRSMGEFMGCQEVYTCLPQKASFQYFWTGTNAFHPLDLPVGVSASFITTGGIQRASHHQAGTWLLLL